MYVGLVTDEGKPASFWSVLQEVQEGLQVIDQYHTIGLIFVIFTLFVIEYACAMYLYVGTCNLSIHDQKLGWLALSNQDGVPRASAMCSTHFRMNYLCNLVVMAYV